MNSKALDQFYTKPHIAKYFYNKTRKFIKNEKIKFDTWLEPSAGKGSFFNLLPKNKIGLDLDPKIENIILHDFLTYQLADKKYITIGNPPFGKNSSLAIKFFNKCAEKSIIIGFIVPKTFKKTSVINRLDSSFHLVFEEELPPFSFEYEHANYHVPCVFQIWQKKEVHRPKIEDPKDHPDFLFTKKESASFAIQRVGTNAGKVKKSFEEYAISSHYFIKAKKGICDTFQEIDWSSVKNNTAGNPSISKAELIKLYELQKCIA